MEKKCAEGEGKRTVKTKVRMFRAEDAIWMVLPKKERENEWLGISIDADGFCLDVNECSESGIVVGMHAFRMNWEAVASELGFDTCEYVLNQDGTPFVLLYDTEELNDARTAPARA